MEWTDALVGAMLGGVATEAIHIFVKFRGWDRLTIRSHTVRITLFSIAWRYGTLVVNLKNGGDQTRNVKTIFLETKEGNGSFSSRELSWANLGAAIPSIRNMVANNAILPGGMQTLVLHDKGLETCLHPGTELILRLVLDDGSICKKRLTIRRRHFKPNAIGMNPGIILIDAESGYASVPTYPPTSYYARVDEKAKD